MVLEQVVDTNEAKTRSITAPRQRQTLEGGEIRYRVDSTDEPSTIAGKVEAAALDLFPESIPEDLGVVGDVDLLGLFRSQTWKGTSAIAWRVMYLQRCVRIRFDAAGKYVKTMPDGSKERLKVDRFPIFGTPYEKLTDYGCSVAVTLYLRIQFRAAILFLIMFLVSIPQVANSIDRNLMRNTCRVAWLDAAPLPDGCGYDTLRADGINEAASIRGENLTEVAPAYLLPALGTCQEYSNLTSLLLVAPALSGAAIEEASATVGIDASELSVSEQDAEMAALAARTFVATPDASYCVGDGEVWVYWLGALNFVVYMLFLFSIKRMMAHESKRADQERITTGDFAMLISRLPRGMFDDHVGKADELKDAVVKLMQAPKPQGAGVAAFSAADIHHVELGRECKTEVKLIKRMAALESKKAELGAKFLSKHNQNEELIRTRSSFDRAEAAKLQDEAISEINNELKETMAELRTLQKSEDLYTGHAFVVFECESNRNKCVDVFRRTRLEWLGNKLGYGDPPPKVLDCAVTAESAPEPSDVFWQNLEVPEWRAWAGSFFTYFVSGCILAGGLVLQLWLKVKAQEVSDPEVAAALLAGGGELPDANTVELFRSYWSLLLSSLSSGVIVGLNVIVQKVVQWLASYEGCPTRTEYQRAVFTKLTLVYVVNNVMIPFLVALLPVGVNQGWYERGGAVNQAFITIVLNIVFTEGLKLFQYMALFNRYIRAPFVVSQQRKNELWQPPEMPLGEMYAATVKAVALTLVYAPMWPLAYLVSAVGLFLAFWCSKLAIIFWYAAPPLVDAAMTERMRDALGVVGLLQLISMGLAYGRTTSWAEVSLTQGGALVPFYIALGFWALYELVPLNLVTGGWTSLYDGSKYEDSDCKYSDIGPNAVLEKNRRPRLPRYVCPGTPQGDNARTVEETVREAVAVGLCGKTWALSRQDANVGEYAQNAAPAAEIATDGVQAQERV